jgi:thioredoxin 1
MTSFPQAYSSQEPSRAEVDALPGATLLEFGSNTCGICRAAQAHIAQALQDAPGLRHLKIEDGSGRPLGRSFGIKLWPTLVFLRDGKETARVVRPAGSEPVRAALREAVAA